MSQEAEVRLRLVADTTGAKTLDAVGAKLIEIGDAEKNRLANIAASNAALAQQRREAEAVAKAMSQGMPAGSTPPGMPTPPPGMPARPAGQAPLLPPDLRPNAALDAAFGVVPPPRQGPTLPQLPAPPAPTPPRPIGPAGPFPGGPAVPPGQRPPDGAGPLGKAADALERFRKEVERAAESLGKAGGRREGGRADGLGEGGGGGLGRGGRPEPHGESPAFDPAAHAAQARESAKAALARQDAMRQAGLGASGLTAAEEARQGIAAQKRSEAVRKERDKQEGMSFLTPASAVLTAAVAATEHVGEVARRHNEINANPYLSQLNRNEQLYQATFGWANGLRTAFTEIGAYGRGEGEERRTRSLQNQWEDHATGTALATHKMETLRPDGHGPAVGAEQRRPVQLPDDRRDTVGTARRYQEELSMMGLREKAEAAKERMAAASAEERKLGGVKKWNAEVIAALEAGIVGRAKQLADSERQDVEDNKGKESERTRTLRTDQEREHRKQVEYLRQNMEITEMEKASRLESIRARGEMKSAQSGPEFHRARQEVLGQRESEAQGQARSLGMAGPEARFMAQAALEQLKQAGIDNAPQEVISQANSLFPKMVAEMAEKAGQRMQPDFKKAAPEEYQFDLAEVRKDADENRRRMQESAASMGKEIAREMADALQQFTSNLTAHLGAQLAAEFRRVQVEKMIEANNK